MPDAPPRLVTISPAVARVVTTLARTGGTDRQIGHDLYLAPDTVKAHIKAALRASGCQTRTELVVALYRGQIALVRPKGST